MSNHYDIPSWAGKPPSGLHLDVMKNVDGREDKLIQKLMIDEKRCYLFGRNPQINDFCIDHASCSRVHAAFVYHKHLNIAYLVDLGSTHGTFIGAVRLEGHKPTPVHINSQFSFGASTRHYILRERPTVGSRTNIMEDIPMMDATLMDGTFLGLPESQTELDNLTEYNTAHNRRISMLGIADDSGAGAGGPGGPGGGPGTNNGGAYKAKNKKRKRKGVAFNEDEIIINPEDIDPSIGRFRNLIQSTVVPVSAKRAKMEGQNSMGIITSPPTSASKTVGFHLHPHHHQLGGHQHHGQQQSGSFVSPSLYHGIDPVDGHGGDSASAGHDGRGGFGSFDMDTTPSSLTTKLGIMLPNPAPDVNPTPMSVTESATASAAHVFATPGTIASGGGGAPSSNTNNAAIMSDNPGEMSDEPKKKKYAKEQWPGRKPLGLGSF